MLKPYQQTNLPGAVMETLLHPAVQKKGRFNMKNKNFKLLMLLLLLISFISYSGCATIFSGSREEISFTSEPDGAKVLFNGQDKGTTPLKISLKKSKEHKIEFVKEGYEKKSFKLSYSLGAGWLILDILCGLVGIIVDAATGNWNGFDEDSYKAVLEPANK